MSLRQRPESFRFDYTHSLARGLVYANFGTIHGSNYYTDDSGYGNHGLCTNIESTADWIFDSTIGRFGINFDGNNEYVDLGTINVGNPLMLAGKNVCICALVKQGSGGDQFQRIIDKSDNGSAANGYASWLDPTAYQFGLSVDGSNWRVTDTNIYSANTWVHTIGIFTPTYCAAYINGREISGSFYAGSVTTIPNVVTNARIGTWNHSDTREFDGIITDLMIYNRFLSSKEISMISDIDNVMYSGLLKYPKRRFYPVKYIFPEKRYKVGRLLLQRR